MEVIHMGNVTITRENEKTVIHLSGRIDSSESAGAGSEFFTAYRHLRLKKK